MEKTENSNSKKENSPQPSADLRGSAASEQTPERLSEKIQMPSHPLMVLVPVLGLASVVALGLVVVLGVKMMNTLARQTGSGSRAGTQLQRLEDDLKRLTLKVEAFQARQEALQAETEAINSLVTELYLSRPRTAREKERVRLSSYTPSQLLEAGLAALKREDGKPVPYFEALLENYQDSPQAPAAMLHLGIMRVRGADYEEASAFLRKYLKEHADPSSQDTVRTHYYLAMALNGIERWAEAAQHYETALKGFTQGDFYRATACLNLAEIYLRLGQKKKAAFHFKELLREFDGDRRAVNMLQRARERLRSLK